MSHIEQTDPEVLGEVVIEPTTHGEPGCQLVESASETLETTALRSHVHAERIAQR